MSCVKPVYANAGCCPPNADIGYMGAGYMPGIEDSPGCGRFRIPGLGIIPVWSCTARGDGVSARRQETGLPAGLSLLRPGERSRLPRLVSSASRASILKFLDFSMTVSLGGTVAESYKNTRVKLGRCAPVLCRASARGQQSLFYSQTHAFP